MIETEKLSNVASQASVILGRPFLATANAIINCVNGMVRLSFGRMTFELNIFNMQRQPSGFDDMEFSTLNLVEGFVLDDNFDDMFAAEYESLLMDNKFEYDVFEFDDLCSATDCPLASVSEYAYEFVSPPILKLKPLPDSFMYAFLGPSESLPMIVAFNRDRDQEDKLIAVLRESKEAIGYTLGIARVLVSTLCYKEFIWGIMLGLTEKAKGI